MKFIDEVEIVVKAGNGGNGCVSFRREKFIPRGGPDGGNGGHGGSIIFKVDPGLNTLSKFRGKKKYFAEDGETGAGRQKDGKSGEDIIIKVPVGTVITNLDSEEKLLDLTELDQEVLFLEGGRGGVGNTFFKTSTNQAPRFAGSGEVIESIPLKLELKLIADIGLIGLPNAGKSTLISAISAAKPKVADYPFTTLEPNLGVCDIGEKSVVIADIPGIIEDAHSGKGLGIKFLKHIERSSAFVHLIDISWCLNVYEAYESYTTIKNELIQYNEELLNKKEIICLTKIDAMTEEEIKVFQDYFEETLDKKVLPISSVTGKNIDRLKRLMLKTKE